MAFGNNLMVPPPAEAAQVQFHVFLHIGNCSLRKLSRQVLPGPLEARFVQAATLSGGIYRIPP